MTSFNRIIKRIFDLTFASIGLLVFGWLILLGALIAYLDTGKNGFFVQKRVGKNAKLISVIKLRTMRNLTGFSTTITTSIDPRISKTGRILRNFKIDELPQLINVFIGNMSLVGPRPDVLGYADLLQGVDYIILQNKPGITGPATLFFRFEEVLLSKNLDAKAFNDKNIWPKKIELNKDYFYNYSLFYDIKYLVATALSIDLYKGKREKIFNIT